LSTFTGMSTYSVCKVQPEHLCPRVPGPPWVHDDHAVRRRALLAVVVVRGEDGAGVLAAAEASLMPIGSTPKIGSLVLVIYVSWHKK
jgi:hypothetical protein